MNNNKNIESLLKEAFLNQDFESEKNAALLNAMAESTLNSSLPISSIFSLKEWINGWKGFILIGAVIAIGTIYFIPSNPKYEFEALNLNEIEIESIDTYRIRPISVKNIISFPSIIPFKEPKKATTLYYEIKESIEDTVKVYRPEGVKEIPILTASEKEEHLKQKEKFIKSILKVSDDRLVEVKVFSQYIRKDEEGLNDFLIWKTELSNFEYNLFLNDLLIQAKEEDYLIAKINKKGWTEFSDHSFMEPMDKMYAEHPAYNDYPVVNISREGAKLYCEWLTDEIQKSNKNKNRLKTVRIPTNREWEYSASSGESQNKFPWGGPSLKNAKDCYLANFKPEKDSFVDDGGLLTVNVLSYAPNKFGLYNVSGNVAEMVYYPYENNQIGARGGSWTSNAQELEIYAADPYLGMSKPIATIGFRPIIEYEIPRQNGRIVGVYSEQKPKLTEKQKVENYKRKTEMVRNLLKVDKDEYSQLISGSMRYKNKTLSVEPFVMKLCEVTNIEYKTFLFDLIIEERFDEFERAKPNFDLWTQHLKHGEPYARHYFSHVAYDNYPVVNISPEGAKLFCVWLLSEAKKIDIKNRLQNVGNIRLPTYEEWIYVASYHGTYTLYPWEGIGVRNSSKKYKGQMLANFRRSKEEFKNGSFIDNAEILAHARAYWPNQYGVYNIVGNAAEIVQYKDGDLGCKGGSWMDSADELKIYAPDKLKGNVNAAPSIGFRFVLEMKMVKIDKE